jgi:hypothetical protein
MHLLNLLGEMPFTVDVYVPFLLVFFVIIFQVHYVFTYVAYL